MHYTSRAVYEYISKQDSPANSGAGDSIVERKTCRVSGQPFAIFQSDVEFYDKISPTFAGKKFAIPTPTLCPEERQRRRLSFRNERKLYRRQCDASKKSIISIYNPNSPYKVYDQKIWWSDARDPMDYGRTIDSSKTFAEHFAELMSTIPQLSIGVFGSNNCDYNNQIFQSQDCYMTSSCGWSSHAMFGRNIRRSEYVVDVIQVYDSKHVYYSDIILGSEYIFYSQHIRNSYYCYSCINCDSCQYCYGCNDLSNQKYMRENVQISPEEFTSRLARLDRIPYRGSRDNMILEGNEGSVTNNIIYNSKEVQLSYNVKDSTRIAYCTEVEGTDLLRDVEYASSGSHSTMECTSIASNTTQSMFCYNIADCNRVLYSQLCFNSSHLFGCVGLRNKQYCIFNKQYTKEEYEKKVADIIERMTTPNPLRGGYSEWGEFFDPSLSPFGYNETVAMEYFPISRDMLAACPIDGRITNASLQQYGYHRSDYNADPVIPEGVQCIRRSDYTDEQRKELGDSADLETKIFICSISQRPYRLQKAEIEFYRKHHLPLPDRHPDVRHEERMGLRPRRELSPNEL